MATRIDQIAGGVYRIAQWGPESRISFNQFLIADEHPTVIHTGRYGDYEGVHSAISQVLDPSTLEYVILLHFEADECGGRERFLEAAPRSTLAGSWMSVEVNLRQWGYRGELRGFKHGETLDLGVHRLRFLETPHVHHRDSLMLFEEETRGMFPADLFMQGGEQPPVVEEDLGSEMCEMYRSLGIFAHEKPVHGGTLTKAALPAYVKALREEPFAFDGRLIGRQLPRDV